MIDSLVKLFTTTAPDFEVLWFGARDSLTLMNPYLNTQVFTTNANPPHSLLFYAPLAFLEYYQAQSVFLIISIISVFISILFSLKLVSKKVSLVSFTLVLILFLLSFPLKFTLGMGQSNLIAGALLLGSYLLYTKNKKLLSGFLLGLAFSYKTIFIYFLLFFLIKKEWKVIVSSLSVLLVFVLSVFLITGSFDLYKFYFSDIIPQFLNFSDREIYYNQGISSFISRIIEEIKLRQIVTSILSIVFVFINIFSINKSKSLNLSFSITIITLLLIDTLSWQHHFVWMLFPFVLLWQLTKRKYIDKLFLLLSYLLVSINVPGIVSLNSHVFFGTLIFYFINLKYIK